MPVVRDRPLFAPGFVDVELVPDGGFLTRPDQSLQLDMKNSLEKIIKSAGRTMVLISGGARTGDKELLENVKRSFEAGATGLVFGRNFWQRPFDNAIDISNQIKKMMEDFSP